MEIENFFGCYLLYSLNEKYKGRTYIGFTVDPNRRIKMHNGGLKAGGAWKTSNKGPWEMILIVHGFPNNISALRFEWAWQHPEKSRRLRHLGKKSARESSLKFRFKVMSEMLRVGPWNRLPLTIRWLNEKYRLEFEVSKLPPLHMPICSGHVMCHKVSNSTEPRNKGEISCIETCRLCDKLIQFEEKSVLCFQPGCKTPYHIICLAQHFLSTSKSKEHLIPVEGTCLNCQRSLLWGDIVRYAMGCYQNETPFIEEA